VLARKKLPPEQHGIFALLCVLLLACGADRRNQNSAGEEDDADYRSARLTLLEISRPTRSATEVAQRAADLVEALLGVSVPPSQAISWAEDAVANRHLGAGAFPFSAIPNVSVHYIPYTDMMIIRDHSIGSNLQELLMEGSSSGVPDPGIGKSTAIARATVIFDRLALTEHISGSAWSMTDSYRVQEGFVDAGTPYRWIKEYVLEYRRHVDDVPLLGTSVLITVHRTGQVSALGLADVNSVRVGRAPATLTAEGAEARFIADAEAAVAHFDPVPETLLKFPRVAYTIPEADESGVRGPEFFAGFVYRYPTISSRVQLGVVPLTGSDHSLRILEDYQGDPLPPASDGSLCRTDGDCQSERCYVFNGYYGFCGACAGDADCGEWGCNPPNPILAPPAPSRCGTGRLGDGCETGAACQTGLHCTSVAESALGFGLMMCSECITDADCSRGTYCEPALDVQASTAARVCARELSLGSTCERDAACDSGHCVPYVFPEGSTVGICSACSDDSHCEGLRCMPPSFEVGSGFNAGGCF
jgi:hypothetical protein